MKDLFNIDKYIDNYINDMLRIDDYVKTYYLPDGSEVKVGKVNGVTCYQFPETGMRPKKLDLEMRLKLRLLGVNV